MFDDLIPLLLLVVFVALPALKTLIEKLLGAGAAKPPPGRPAVPAGPRQPGPQARPRPRPQQRQRGEQLRRFLEDLVGDTTREKRAQESRPAPPPEPALPEAAVVATRTRERRRERPSTRSSRQSAARARHAAARRLAPVPPARPRGLGVQNWGDAIILAEILGPPRAKRRGHRLF